MPLIIILLCLVAGTVSSCEEAKAFSINESQQEFDDRLDYDSIKDEACQLLNCPSMGGLHVDEVKMDGAHLASIQASIHFYF